MDRLKLLMAVFALAVSAYSQTPATRKPATPAQPIAAPGATEPTAITKEFATAVMAAVEAINSNDGSRAAERAQDHARARLLSIADMEPDDKIRQNEEFTAKFGLLMVSMTHKTYSLSGSDADRKEDMA